MDNTQKGGGGVGIGMVLFIIFLILKLTDTIDWSWWWVTCPLWAPFAIFTAIMIVLFLGATLQFLINLMRR